jgi:purine-cytosine permease-like protein
MTPVLAHFGHWWGSLLYLAPVVVVVGWLSLQSWLDNRRGDENERDG